MAKQKSKEENVFVCPVGKFFQDVEKIAGRKSEFFNHLSQSRIEFLKAIRSLVEQRIEAIETRKRARSERKMRKIEVD